MKCQLFTVTGMSCAACSARVEKIVGAIPGVEQVQVNLLARTMRVVYNERNTSNAEIIATVSAAGYGASEAVQNAPSPKSTKGLNTRLIASVSILIPIMLLHHCMQGVISVILQLLLLIPIVWLNRQYFISGIKAVKSKAPNMDTLVCLGASAAVIYSIVDIVWLKSGASYVESAGMILTIISLGKWLENRATGHTGDALNKLKELLPATAVVERNGRNEIIPCNEVCPGDTLIIAAGSKIPVDAEIVEGSSSIDESYLTGESMPAFKQAGSKIYAGTINGNGALKATALCAPDKCVLHGIINLVGEATASKAPIARLADQISGIFVPVVVFLAILTTVIWLLCEASISFTMGCAIAVLVISCPCALGLATPVAIMVGAGKGAENGILFRNAASMEQACQTSAVVLDKTGTLTAGAPIITDILPADGVSKSTLMQLACSIEQNNNHPIAQCISKSTSLYTPEEAEQLQYLPGLGISAIIGGATCFAGNIKLMQDNGIATPGSEHGGMTPIYFARNNTYMGMFLISDPLKPDSTAAVEAMKSLGLKIIIMSGDESNAVRRVASKLGIEDFYFNTTPAGKEANVKALQQEGHCVAMIGDGINDAPALARANISVAIGSGTDVAIESAGIVLVRNELTDAVSAFKLSRSIMRTIRQNLFWAFIYNVLAIPLAAGLYYPLLGWQLTPGVAATAMSLSSLFVVFNALRLRHCNISIPQTVPMKQTITISVTGMMCPHCERHVTQALNALPGVTDVKADHKSASVSLCTDGAVDEALLASTIRNAGYEYKGTR